MGITVTLTEEDAQEWLKNKQWGNLNTPLTLAEDMGATPLAVAAAPVPTAPEVAAAFALPPPPAPVVQDTGIPTAPPVQPAGIDVDAKGLPWDGRIHASTRAKIADGTWRMKRGVDDTVVNDVTAELRQTMGLGVPPASVVVPPVPFVAPAVPPAPPASIILPPVPAGAAPSVSPNDNTATFPKLMQKITAAFAAKTLDQSAIQAAVQSAGLPSLPMLASRPDLVPVVADKLGITL